MSLPFDLAFARPGWLLLLALVPLVLLPGYLLGRKRGVRPASIWLRAGAMTLLIIALAEPLWSSGAAAPATVVVVDRSASLSSETSSSVVEWLNNALSDADSDDRAAIVTFGGNALVDQPAGDAGSMIFDAQTGALIDSNATNIGGALAVARTLPVGDTRRIVLISDGAENSGSALDQAVQAASEDTVIDVLTVDGIGDRDLRIDAVSAPEKVWQGESMTVQTSVVSAEEGSGTIRLFVGKDEVAKQEVDFRIGLNTYSFTLDDLGPGFHQLRVELDPGSIADAFTENNAQPFGVVVRDAAHLLFVSQDGADNSFLIRQLEEQGVQITQISPIQIPERLSELTVYDAIVLDNVPVTDMTVGQIAALEQSTRTLGRGLIVIGGTSAYGPGGYANTPLEDLLPVDVKVTEGKERQRVALLLIIDKSGSMALDPSESISKIDMAKEAVQLAAGALLDGDEIAVLAFNDRQQWIMRLTRIDGQDDRDRINASVNELESDGGTEIYPALDIGFDEISKSEADVRHIVLLSDGKSSTGTRESYTKLVQEMQQTGTTLSTIAIGEDADTDLLQYLAEAGGGHYSPAVLPEDIPRLTLQEAQGAGSQSVVRGEFQPIQVLASPIMDGFVPEDLPVLAGYDYTEIKSGAQLVLSSNRNDPVLAKWQYGLGRVVAWTADDGVDFANAWQRWDGYGDFWENMIQWALPDPERGAVDVTSERSGSDALITLSSTGDAGDYVDLSNATVTITGPSGESSNPLKPYQSAPGEWQLRVQNPPAGAYQISVDTGDGSGSIASLSTFSIPPSAELKPDPDAADLMQQLAHRTGGRVLSLDDPGALFDAPPMDGSGIASYRAVWWLPLSLGLFLVLLELGYRYNALDRLRRPLRS
ncbi:MAG: VWA domain-containing protein [Thermomicrobiales bacterium]|nr:MAG: VWA domain-containing protein [Thermomicrobiales bacterium]